MSGFATEGSEDGLGLNADEATWKVVELDGVLQLDDVDGAKLVCGANVVVVELPNVLVVEGCVEAPKLEDPKPVLLPNELSVLGAEVDEPKPLNPVLVSEPKPPLPNPELVVPVLVDPKLDAPKLDEPNPVPEPNTVDVSAS